MARFSWSVGLDLDLGRTLLFSFFFFLLWPRRIYEFAGLCERI